MIDSRFPVAIWRLAKCLRGCLIPWFNFIQMPSRKSKEKFNLVVAAHPDDETLFFGGLLQKKLKGLNWKVICVTSDGNENRLLDFKKACSQLSVRDSECWQYPDVYSQRLAVSDLVIRLQSLPTPAQIFTHSPMGEYGHPHHQDVCVAVHRAFQGHKNIYSVAYNLNPDFIKQLDQKMFYKKSKILIETYKSETSRFLNILPITFSEGFVKLKHAEVEAIYSYFTDTAQASDLSKLRHHAHLMGYLPHLKNLKRPF